MNFSFKNHRLARTGRKLYERALSMSMQQGFLLGAVKPLPYFYLVTATLGVLFTFISPDSHRSLLGDLIFWLSQTLLPLTAILFVHLYLARLTWFSHMSDLWKLILSGVSGVLLYLPTALWLDAKFDHQPIDYHRVGLVWECIEEFFAVGPPILIGWLAMNAPWLLGFRFERQDNKKAMPEPATLEAEDDIHHREDLSSCRFEDYPSFFPPNINDIVCLKAELHYLQVVTIDGRSLELFNLRDAVKFLSSVDGISPHRSWWVNRRFIEGYVPAGRQGKLIVQGNLEIPVSRRKTTEIKLLLKQWEILSNKS